MSYSECMEIAGAEVLEMQYFGSYQGDWIAKVRRDGETGWVRSGYGSCGGCDAFLSEFDMIGHDHGVLSDGTDYSYVSMYDIFENPEAVRNGDCDKCKESLEKARQFGLGYIKELESQEEAEAALQSNINDYVGDYEDYSEYGDQLKFVKEHAVEKTISTVTPLPNLPELLPLPNLNDIKNDRIIPDE